MLKKLKSLYRDERGFETVEWIILGTLVAGMATVGVMAISGGITTAAGTVNTNLQGVVNSAGSNNVTW